MVGRLRSAWQIQQVRALAAERLRQRSLAGRADVADQQRRFPNWLGIATLGVGLLGFAVYAITRAGYEAFYDQFHVTLEEVGLNEATIAAKAGVALALLLFIVIAAVAVTYPFDAWLRNTGFARVAVGLIAAVLISLLAGGLFRFVLRGEFIQLGGPFLLSLDRAGKWQVFVALALLDLVVVSVVELYRNWKGFAGAPGWWVPVFVLLLVVSSASFLWLMRVAVVNEGTRDAKTALHGCKITSPLLDLRPEFVTIEPKPGSHDDVSPESPNNVMLLLSSDKSLVLYDFGVRHPPPRPRPKRQTERFPANSVTFAGTSPLHKRCPP